MLRNCDNHEANPPHANLFLATDAACCVSRVARCVLLVACCVLHVTCGVWRVACCVLHVACGVWRVACCVLRVACCVLRVQVPWGLGKQGLATQSKYQDNPNHTKVTGQVIDPEQVQPPTGATAKVAAQAAQAAAQWRHNSPQIVQKRPKQSADDPVSVACSGCDHDISKKIIAAWYNWISYSQPRMTCFRPA